MYRSIVVPLDLERHGDRALPVAAGLARLGGLPVELVTVSSPAMPEAADRYDLETRAEEAGAPNWTVTVVHDNDPAAALIQLLAARPGALVVMATRARGPFGEVLLGSVSEALLGRVDQPILFVGPRARADEPAARPTLVAGVGDGSGTDAVVPALVEWQATFDGPAPWLVQVLPLTRETVGHGDVVDSADVHRMASALAARGVPTEWEVTHARQPATALVDFADHVPDAVLVAASARWTDRAHHLGSVARRLAQQAHQPVLVVPVAQAAAS